MPKLIDKLDLFLIELKVCQINLITILQIKGQDLLKTLSVGLLDVILQHLIGFVLLSCCIYSCEASKVGINFGLSKMHFGGFHLLSIFPKTKYVVIYWTLRPT